MCGTYKIRTTVSKCDVCFAYEHCEKDYEKHITELQEQILKLKSYALKWKQAAKLYNLNQKKIIRELESVLIKHYSKHNEL